MNRLTVEFHESAATLATTTNVSKNVSATIFDSCTRASPVATPQKEPSKIIEKELSSKKKLNDTTDKKKRRKKKWKKPKDKPSRPLSAYNLFFQSERAQMLGDDAPTPEQESLKKRVHCKTHGKIGFAEMARNIGAKWKSLDPTVKQPFLDRASREKERYATELAVWKAQQKDNDDNDSNTSNSGGGSSGGLEAMATVAMASNPMMGFASYKPSGDSFNMLMNGGGGPTHRNNIAMLQQHRCGQDFLRFMQQQQNGSMDSSSSMLGGGGLPQHIYPSAAEASANVIMNHFQGMGQPFPTNTTTNPGGIAPPQQVQNFYEANQISQLMAMRRMQQQQQQQQQRYLASAGQVSNNNEYGLPRR